MFKPIYITSFNICVRCQEMHFSILLWPFIVKVFASCPIKDLLAVSAVRRSKAVNRRLVTTKESTLRPLPVCFLPFLCHHQATVSAFNQFSIDFPVLVMTCSTQPTPPDRSGSVGGACPAPPPPNHCAAVVV